MKIKVLSLLLIGAQGASQVQAMQTTEKPVTTCGIIYRVKAPLAALTSGTTALVLGAVALGCDACDSATKTGLRATAFCLSSISVMYAGYKLRQKCRTIRREIEFAERKKAEADKLKKDATVVQMVSRTQVEDEVAAEASLKASAESLEVSLKVQDEQA